MVSTRSRKARFLQPASTDDSDEQSQSQSSESAAFIGSNDDVLTEILLRLPATSILRFKSVSKHWRSLLSYKLFTVRYDSLIKSPGFFARDVYVSFDVENQGIPPFRTTLDSCIESCGIRIPLSCGGISIVRSCNGLLLCCSNGFSRGVRRYYVFNPTTKQFAKIPSPLGYSTGIYINCMDIAFHCGKFKIVCILTLDDDANLYHDDANLYQIQIYSSDTRKWKISVESFKLNHPFISPFVKGVYMNGAIHWAISYNSFFYFDVNLERLQTCPSPKDRLPSENKIMYLGESRGHLHFIVTGGIEYNMICNFYAFKASALKVYEMLNDHSGWFVKYEVEFHELTSAFPEMIKDPYGYYYDVMDVIRGEKEEDTFMVVRIPGKMIRYNIHDKSFKEIFNDPNNFSCYGYSNFHRYTEALTSF